MIYFFKLKIWLRK